MPAVDGPAIVYFSGNWGWRPIMQDTASHLAANGRYVLGVDSLKYFGTMLDPDEWRKDLTTFRTYLNEKAGKSPDTPVILIGFTYGAEMVPYMMNRGGTEGIAGALLIGPGETGSVLCRLHLQLDIESPEEEQFDVGQELAALPSMPLVLLEGTLDASSKVREMLPNVKSPRKYAPIPGGNRQFVETRDVYFEYAAQAIDWIDTTAQSPPPIDESESRSEAPATPPDQAVGEAADE